ncbi:DsbA family oxidoreductase [Caulobacter rhizosphaerae]|jgi:predicted DsbA family dithiol-disulfide isomerase|uniref:DsbA family oxidoreductase n=1 Tax=Caulobacter rhizosphaerae TaxID=2010972 RepID=UPI0013D416EA|nr:DsbA family oxidoreductase [Caulobacter rhizosphaerae]GGL14573.1 DSBA oxidoreductase [Caulobacter rhizosphaerae]
MGQPLLIDLVADVVCPWCYLGWRRVRSALALRPDVEPLVVWRPYQLDPTLPEQGVDRKAYMAGKFKDPLKLKAVHAALVEAGAEEDIVFDFDVIERSPNTSAAHRLIRWAHGAGKQDAVVEALFAAYFTQGRDIGEPAVLADIGQSAGMDPVVILRLLSEGADKDVVAREHAMAVQAGVTGVPFAIFGGKLAVVGAESPENIAQAIDKALEQAA